ncbi:MAG: hypothetical protein KGM92_05265 [Acidobacteriota bacterium]|nr:hypothetical protein [Acidobacteriota bacterium]
MIQALKLVAKPVNPMTHRRQAAPLAGGVAIPLLVMCAAASAAAQQTKPERLIQAGHWKQARAIVESHLHESPDDPLATFLLSQIRHAFGEDTTPLRLAERAVALNGRVAKFHRQLAEVLGVRARRAGPIQELLLARRFRKEIDLAIELDPRDAQALRDLLEFYLLAPGIAGGDLRKAEQTAERILNINAPEGFLANARIASFERRASETEALLRQAARAQPLSYRAQIELARFYLDKEPAELEAAETAAKVAAKLDPSRVDSYAVLSRIYADRAEWTELEAVLQQSSRQVPDDLAPYYRAAEQLLGRGRDPSRSERYFRVYLAQEPEGNEPPAAEAHWKLGLALEAQGHLVEAIAEWEQALRLDRESPAARELKRLRGSRAADAQHVSPGLRGAQT